MGFGKKDCESFQMACAHMISKYIHHLSRLSTSCACLPDTFKKDLLLQLVKEISASSGASGIQNDSMVLTGVCVYFSLCLPCISKGLLSLTHVQAQAEQATND